MKLSTNLPVEVKENIGISLIVVGVCIEFLRIDLCFYLLLVYGLCFKVFWL
jgi:hypothetical protein